MIIDIVGLVAIAALVVSVLSLILTQRHQGKVDYKKDTERLTRMEESLKLLPEISEDVKSLRDRMTTVETKLESK